MTPIVFAIHLLVALLVDNDRVVIIDRGPFPNMVACRVEEQKMIAGLAVTHGRLDERAVAFASACKVPGMDI